MSNRLSQILLNWQSDSELQWVLATLIDVQGSSYRKPGAIMLINSLGQYFGMLSGGCLEADIMRQSRRTMDDGQSRIVVYDMSDEDDLSWQLGIGCGGRVEILLQAVNESNNALLIPELISLLSAQHSAYLIQNLAEGQSQNLLINATDSQSLPTLHQAIKSGDKRAEKFGFVEHDNSRWFYQKISPNPHIAIFGGGTDALPVVNMAKELGWLVTLVDPRAGYAREAYFNNANHIYHTDASTLTQEPWFAQIDVAVVMNHNVKLDASALLALQQSSAQYVGMLGPEHRTDRVFDELDINREQLSKPLSNPVGLNLGGDLPETIALSILSEAQAVLAQRDALSFSIDLSTPQYRAKLHGE